MDIIEAGLPVHGSKPSRVVSPPCSGDRLVLARFFRRSSDKSDALRLRDSEHDV